MKVNKIKKVISIFIMVFLLLKTKNVYAEQFKEKIVVSFLGDSITTYENYTNYSESANYYREEKMPVDSTWWMKILDMRDWKLGVNESIGGTRVSWDGMTEDENRYIGRNYNMSSDVRIDNLGNNGIPDKIFIFGGMNDILSCGEVPIENGSGEYHYGKEDNFADAYYTMVCKVEQKYPDAEIICLIPYHTIYSLDSSILKENTESVANVIQDICNRKNINFVDLRKINLEGQNDMETADYIHPNERGMEKIAYYVLQEIIEDFGRVEDSGKYVYYDEYGNLIKDKIVLDEVTGELWYFDKNGYQVFDEFVNIGDDFYYFDVEGNKFDGEVYVAPDGNTYYFRDDSTLIRNEWYFDGEWTYYLQADGTPMKDRLTYHPDGEHIIYFDQYGHEVFNAFQYCSSVGYTCYFGSQGYLCKDQITFVADKVYYLNANGTMEQNGWFQFANGRDYGYANADGTLRNTEFSYDGYGRLVYYHWNGMVARGLIYDGVYYYNMCIDDGHYLGQFM